MIKRPFLAFITVIGLLIVALLLFIESAQFAGILKTVASRYLPKDMGIQADFSELSIKLFPPGFSVKNPKIALGPRNIANLPPGSSVIAERIDFKFHLFQMFSGDIRVNEVSIINGHIQLVLNSSKKSESASNGSRLDFHWDELFHVRAEAFALENVAISLRIDDSAHSDLEVMASSLRLAQWSGRGGLGYSLHLDLKAIRGGYLKKLSLPEGIDSVYGNANVNALALSLDSLKISALGLEGLVVGQIRGNILEPKSLLMDSMVTIKGEMNEALKSYLPSTWKEYPTGALSFSGKVQGNLQKLQETLKADGTLKLQNATYQSWSADSVTIQAKWAASSGGGEISLEKAVISSKEEERIGGSRPGKGGKIEFGPLKWVAGSTQPFNIPIHLERAHVHWFAGPGAKKIHGLDFRVSGDIATEVRPGMGGRPWQVLANLNSRVDQFQLDNQKYRQEKPLKVIFKIPRIELKGPVTLDATGIHPNDLVLSLPHSKIHANGKIDFKTGYDLHASGALNLADLGQIAENEIQGTGTANIHVHGPSSQALVDIDIDFKDAFYLNLFLGGVKGRITWDDDPSRILFSRAQVVRDSTLCSVEGSIDVGLVDAVALDVKISRGDIKDLIYIFKHLTAPIGWFPHTLNGPVEGEIKVSGGTHFNQLKLLSRLHGTNWEHWGERFKSVRLTGGYDAGKYFISDSAIEKRSGKLLGKISYSAEKKVDWEFHTENFAIGDIDSIARLDVPMRGRFELDSVGSGPDGAIKSTTEVTLSDFSVRGVAMPSSQMRLRTQKGVVKAQLSAMEGHGLLDVSYDFNPKELSYIRGELKQFDFSPILLMLNSRSLQDKALAGRVSGLLNLAFRSGEVERGTGVLNITEYLLARQDTAFELGAPLSVKIQDGNFDIKDASIKGRSGKALLNLKGRNARLEGAITGDIDLSMIEFFIPSIVHASGTAKLDLSMGGTVKDPTLFGRMILNGDSISVASLESPFDNVTGVLQLRQNVLSLQKIGSDLGGGRVVVDGRIVINSDRYPSVYLKSTINSSKIKVYPFQYAQVSGTVGVHGDEVPYLVDGNLVIDSALSKEKVMNQKNVVSGRKALQYGPPPTKQGEGNYPKFKLNIDVEAQKGVMVQNDLFRDVQAKGNLTIVNTLETPRIVGIVELIQGKLIFKNHAFQIQSATANFDNPTVINPSLDLNAETDVNGVKIRLYVTGRPDKIKVEFTSNPTLQESEILSLLTVGLTSNDAKKLSASDLSVVQQGEAASLVLHSLDFNREIEDKTGFRLQLDESVNTQQGTSAFRPSSQSDTAAAPQITIRRKLGDRISLSAGSTVGAGTNRSNQVNVDFSVNSDVSVSGVFNNYGTSSGTNSTTTDVQSSTQATQNSYGVDLKFQKRFK